LFPFSTGCAAISHFCLVIHQTYLVIPQICAAFPRGHLFTSKKKSFPFHHFFSFSRRPFKVAQKYLILTILRKRKMLRFEVEADKKNMESSTGFLNLNLKILKLIKPRQSSSLY
jgi:hypothetical protein